MTVLKTYPYKCRETSLSDREVEVLVELVAKNDQERIRWHVTGVMRSDGYDLLRFSKGPLGDLIFNFRKNRNVDWGKYYGLVEKWYQDQAKLVAQERGVSFNFALTLLKHPYWGTEPPKELLLECTTEIDLPPEADH